MIELYNDYCIGVDDAEWTLYRKRKNADGTKAMLKGREYTNLPLAYTGSLKQALKAFRRRLISDDLQNASVSLTEAIERIEEIDNRFERFVSENIPDA